VTFPRLATEETTVADELRRWAREEEQALARQPIAATARNVALRFECDNPFRLAAEVED
jgi:hypothetical protein